MSARDFNIASYTKYLVEHKLMASRCDRCQIMFLPPRPLCPQCHSQEMSWQPLKGLGKVLGFTSIAIGPTAMVARGHGRDNPYVTALVQMEEGPSVTALLEGVNAGDLENARIGMPVEADFKEEGEGETKTVTLVFRPR